MTLQLTAEQRIEALRRMTPEMREEFDRLLEGVDPRDVDGFGLWLPEVSPTWSWNWRHLMEVRKALMEVTRGTSRRLMIYQPPRHGKSEMTTIRYPVWRLEKWRDTKVCVGCYNQRFAERFGRKSRQLAEKRGVVSRNRRAAMEWETEKGGVYRSCGVGSPPTGEGFNLIIIDDPVKSREEAESESYRERAWEWYQDLYTRLEPNAAVILMMCMVGSTPVLMDDGTEKPLRDVRSGDQVATYDAGKIGVARVVNWSSRGLDSTYEIKMKSGIMVRANERHPFLVFRSGDTRWVRLTDLMVGDEIVAVTRPEGRGRGRFAATSAARQRLGRKGIACATTTSGVGKEGSGRRPTLPSPYGHPVSSIATGLLAASMSECSLLKTGVAPSVGSLRGQMCAPIGVGNSASITTPRQERSEGCCATTATSRLGTERRKNDCSEPLNTCEITRDRIESITYYGIEEVFDVQIEGTENFIANGLVSHNTRWHEDDLAGRLLEERLGGDQWKVVSMPALDDDGKALWPERFPRDVLEQYRRVLGEYAFEALYQQRPTAREGNLFKVDRIIEEKAPDEYTTRVRAWDLAATPGGGDWTAGVLLGRNAAGDRWSILDLVRGRWSADERNAIIRTTAIMDSTETRVRFAQDPGQAGKEQAQGLVGMLGGYVAGSKNVTGNKVTRADPLAAQVNAGNVSMARGDWNRELREELRRFPNGKNDDICLIAGTLIETLRGSVPIENVVAGDLVLTRKGYRRVLRAGQTHNNAEVCRLTTSDGRTLTGTPRHPVWVDGKGFVGMEATTDADILSVCESIHPILRLTWWCGAALSSVAIRTRGTKVIRDITLRVREILRKASGLSIVKSGRRVTDLSLKDASSIIGTGILSTTTFPIWSASREAIMAGCIGTQGIAPIQNFSPNISIGSDHAHPSGTSPKKAVSGTSSMACEHSEIGVRARSFADRAARLSRVECTEAREPTICGSAQSGAPPGNAEQRDGSGWRRSARSAQRRSWGSREFAPAPVSVVNVYGLTERVPVYNLAVDGEQEYFANGILTHNCDAVSDAFAELAMSAPWEFF